MEHDICKCNAHLKGVRGFGGFWGDRGETIMTRKHFVLAMAISPPVPLDERNKD